MALVRRRPDPGLIHHSDQGSQYVSLAFGRAAGEAGLAVSLGSRGDAYDNAVAETFFATLKKELVNRRTWPSRLELQSAVFEYIEAFYNRRRRHSTLGMLSPTDSSSRASGSACWYLIRCRCWRSTSVNVAPLLAWLKNRSSTAQTSERQLVSPGKRPITLVRRRTSPSDRSSRFVLRHRSRCLSG
jgi:hypothetical protein